MKTRKDRWSGGPSPRWPRPGHPPCPAAAGGQRPGSACTACCARSAPASSPPPPPPAPEAAESVSGAPGCGLPPAAKRGGPGKHGLEQGGPTHPPLGQRRPARSQESQQYRALAQRPSRGHSEASPSDISHAAVCREEAKHENPRLRLDLGKQPPSSGSTSSFQLTAQTTITSWHAPDRARTGGLQKGQLTQGPFYHRGTLSPTDLQSQSST